MMENNRLVLVLGGAKSGKSKFAEQLCPRDRKICYIATGVVKNPDGEMQLRIKRHQARRPACWLTREQYREVDQLIRQLPAAGFLLDDATMLVTNLFYDDLAQHTEPAKFDHYLEKASQDEIAALRQRVLDSWQKILDARRASQRSLVVVSDEVGLGIVPATKQTRVLRDLYGEVNQLLAKRADDVYFVVSGIPQKIK